MLGAVAGVPSLQSFLSMTQRLSKSMQWPNDHACFAMFDPLAHVLTFLICSFPQVFLGKINFYSTLQYMLPMSFSSDVIFFLCLSLISQQAKVSVDWISVVSLDRKRTYHCLKQLTANNGKNAFEKKLQKFTHALSLGPPKWESVTRRDDWS